MGPFEKLWWLSQMKGTHKEHTHTRSYSMRNVCPIEKFWTCEDYHEYKAEHGDHFSKPLAEWAVGGLMPKGKWTCDQVHTALKAMGVEVSDRHKYDVYFHANHLYSDYGTLLTDAQILQMVQMALDDEDGYSEMIFGRYLTDCMYKKKNIDWAKMM